MIGRFVLLILFGLFCLTNIFSQSPNSEQRFEVATPVKKDVLHNKDGKVILNNQFAFLAAAECSEEAVKAGAKGTVEVEVLINKDGKVIYAKAVSGDPLLKNAAEEAAKNSRFRENFTAAGWEQISGIILFNFDQIQQAKPANNFEVINGKAKKLVKPDYPEAARDFRASGSVNVLVTIDEEGKVISASAISGHPLLKKNAEKAALKTKFTKTLIAGNPIKVTGIIVYNFIVPIRRAATGNPNSFPTIPQRY